jgi:hypothetical protein
MMQQSRTSPLSRLAIASSALSLGLLMTGCLGTDSPSETHYFFGDVYDGVTGQQVKDYRIALEYFGRRYDGSRDANGGFQLPAVPANSDFSVYIDARGFRSFASHHAQFGDVVHADRSYHYEAYLFSTSVPVSDVPVNLTLSDSARLPAGSIRLRPTEPSALYSDPGETPSGIPGQVWTNSNDLLAETVWVDFKDGAATFPGDKLVYGVPYQVTVLNVPGYQLMQDDRTPFQAGIDGRRAFVLAPLTTTPLRLAYMSTRSGNPTPDGSLTMVFNQAAEFDPRGNLGFYREAVDGAFSIDSPDTNNNNVANSLNPNLDPNIQERGTNFKLDGQQLVFTWDPAQGLRTADPGDTIRSVTYGGLDRIQLRRAGGNAADVVLLSDLVGSTSVTVVVGYP